MPEVGRSNYSTRIRADNPSYQAASAFLKRLDPDADCWTFQTLTEGPKRTGQSPRVFNLSLDAAFSVLTQLNKASHGIFVTVNRTNLKGRKADDIVAVRAVFADLDGSPLDPCMQCSLEPSMVVQTSPVKWHVYWLVGGLLRLDQFEEVQWAIAERFKADKSCTDLPRILRVPGFLHQKQDPFLVRIIQDSGGQPYTADAILKEFQPSQPKGTTRQKRQAEIKTTDPILQALNAKGWVIGPSQKESGAFHIKCPYASAHTTPDNDSSTIYYLPNTGGYTTAKIHCFHAHCSDRTMDDYRVELGLESECESKRRPDEWPDPKPLTARIEPERYPLDALPDIIREAVDETFGFIKAPVPLVASSALGALSVALQAHVDVEREEKLSGPTSLFLLTIADSGERKSTCDRFFCESIIEYQNEQEKKAGPLIKRYTAALAAWDAEKEGLLSATRQAGKTGKDTLRFRDKLAELEHDKPEIVRVPRLILGDETPESLAFTLAKKWPTGGVVSSEAGIVFGAHAMGRDSIMRNLALLNLLWDGGTLSIGRKSSESFVLRGSRLSVALQIQEPTLRAFFEQSGGLARGTGFLARFLLAWPESTQGTRFFSKPDGSWPKLSAYNNRLTEILNREVPMNKDGTLNPVMLVFSKKAKAAWIAFHDEIEVRLKNGGELCDVRDVASKIADNAARLAALFQFFTQSSENAPDIVKWIVLKERAGLSLGTYPSLNAFSVNWPCRLKYPMQCG